MNYLYKLPNDGREQQGVTRASNDALIRFLNLDVSKIPEAKRDEYITDAWWEYVEKEDLSNDEANDLLTKVQDEDKGWYPYSNGYAERLCEDIESRPLYELETYLKIMVGGFEIRLIYWQEPDAHYARYHWQILQERVNALTLVPNDAEAQNIKLPRLQAAITWLKGWEQHLAEAEAKDELTAAPLSWQGSKTELIELGYALLESGKLKGSNRGATLSKLGELFGVNLGLNPATHLQTIQKRKASTSATPLLDELRVAFADYVARKDEKEANASRLRTPSLRQKTSP